MLNFEEKLRFFKRKSPENQWFSGLGGGDKRDRTADLLNAMQPKVVVPQRLLMFLVVKWWS